MKTLFAIITSLGLLLPCPAIAQESAPVPDIQESKAVQHYDFDDDLVEAGLDRGNGGIVTVKRRTKVSTLIVVREDFLPELIKSAEDI